MSNEKLTKKSVVELQITALGGQADGVARLADGQVVLIAGAVPGDRLRVALRGALRGVMRGEITKILLPSPQRVQPTCPVFDACGGCSWQQIDLALQRSEKALLTTRALGKSACQLQIVGEIPAWQHRRRVRLHLRHHVGGMAVGMMGRASERVVDTRQCPVLVAELEALLPRIAAAATPWLDRGELHAVSGVEGVIADLHAVVRAGEALPTAESLRQMLDIVGLSLAASAISSHAGRLEVTLPETVGPLPITVDARGFCQATSLGNAAIRHAVSTALAAAGPVARLQEFFAGSGNLSGLLDGIAPQIRTIESDFPATLRAQHTLTHARLSQFTVLHGDATDLAETPVANELWLLDPGRPGAKELMDKIAQLARNDAAPQQIIYVSCALDTLARDLRSLQAAGYTQHSAVMIDTYPHTPHVEVVVHLRLSSAA